MKKITLILITLLMLTCMSSADYTLKKTINGVSVSTTVPEGRIVTLKYLKDTSIFTKWLVKSGGITLSNDTSTTVTFTMPGNDIEIQASLTTDHTCAFTDATCTTPPTCSCGATNGTALGHSYTGTRTCNVNGSTDTVQCARCTSTESQTCTHEYTISKGATTNGTVTLSATSVKAGGSITVTITPASGYEIESIKVNGSSITVSNKAGMTHIISNIVVNQTVTVTFSQAVIIANTAVPIGAYIEYVPTSTNAKVYETDTGDYNEDRDTADYQEFNPNNTQLWRVMYNNNGQLDIVSSDAVYATNGDGLYLYGKTGYAKAVDTLNNLCSQYVNTAYATSGRSIGCTSESVGTIAESAIYYGVTGSIYIDELYTTDINRLKDTSTLHGTLLPSGGTWLASRRFDSGTNYTNFHVRAMTTSGTDSYFGPLQSLFSATGTNQWEYPLSAGVRVVVSLDATTKIIDGEGTVTSPYIITK